MAQIELKESYQTKNFVVDRLMPHLRTVAECKLIAIVYRQTVGWQKADDVLSLSRFEQLSGMGRANIIAALDWLVSVGIVIRGNRTRDGFVYAPQTDETLINWQAIDDRTNNTETKKHKSSVKNLAKANKSKAPSGSTVEPLEVATVEPLAVAISIHTETQINPIKSLDADASKQNANLDSTPPIPTQNVSRTDAMEQKDALAFMFERAMMAKATPAETTIRKWNLTLQLTDLCLMFWQVTNQIVTPEDKGKWSAGAKRLAALLPHGLNQAAMERAYSVMQKDRMTCTHPGAIYEKCKEAIQQAQPKADDDSANWVYTPSGQRVRAQ